MDVRSLTDLQSIREEQNIHRDRIQAESIVDTDLLRRSGIANAGIRAIVQAAPDPNDQAVRVQLAEQIADLLGQTPARVYQGLDNNIRALMGKEYARPENVWEDLNRHLQSAFMSAESGEIQRRIYLNQARRNDAERLAELEKAKVFPMRNEVGPIHYASRAMMNVTPSLVHGVQSGLLWGMATLGVMKLLPAAGIAGATALATGQGAAAVSAMKGAMSTFGGIQSYRRRAAGNMYLASRRQYDQAMEDWQEAGGPGERPEWDEDAAIVASEILGGFTAAAGLVSLREFPGVGRIFDMIGKNAAVSVTLNGSAARTVQEIAKTTGQRYVRAAAAQAGTEFFQSSWEAIGGTFENEFYRAARMINANPGEARSYMQAVREAAGVISNWPIEAGIEGFKSAGAAQLINPLGFAGLGMMAAQDYQIGRMGLVSSQVSGAMDRAANLETLSERERALRDAAAELRGRKQTDSAEQIERVADRLRDDFAVSDSEVEVTVDAEKVKTTARGRNIMDMDVTLSDEGNYEINDINIVDSPDAPAALRAAVRHMQNESGSRNIEVNLPVEKQEQFDRLLEDASPRHSQANAAIQLQDQIIASARGELESAQADRDSFLDQDEADRDPVAFAEAQDRVAIAEGEILAAESLKAQIEQHKSRLGRPDMRMLHEVSMDELVTDLRHLSESRSTWRAGQEAQQAREALMQAEGIDSEQADITLGILESFASARGITSAQILGGYIPAMAATTETTQAFLSQQDARGAFLQAQELGEKVMLLASDADALTAIHELTHDFYDYLPQNEIDIVRQEAAKALGTDVVTREQAQEFLAEAHTEALMQGKIASGPIAAIVEKFRDFFKKAFNAMKGHMHLSDEIVGVLNRMYEPTSAAHMAESSQGLAAQLQAELSQIEASESRTDMDNARADAIRKQLDSYGKLTDYDIEMTDSLRNSMVTAWRLEATRDRQETREAEADAAIGKSPSDEVLFQKLETGKFFKSQWEKGELFGIEGDRNIGGVIDMPKLFAKYPEMKKTILRFSDKLPAQESGYFAEESRKGVPTIVLSTRLKYDKMLRKLAHELQHNIQFAADPQAFRDYTDYDPQAISDRYVELTKGLEPESWQTFQALRKSVGNAQIYTLRGIAQAVFEKHGIDFEAERAQFNARPSLLKTRLKTDGVRLRYLLSMSEPDTQKLQELMLYDAAVTNQFREYEKHWSEQQARRAEEGTELLFQRRGDGIFSRMPEGAMRQEFERVMEQRAVDIQTAVSEGRHVPLSTLVDYASAPWAREEIARRRSERARLEQFKDDELRDPEARIAHSAKNVLEFVTEIEGGKPTIASAYESRLWDDWHLVTEVNKQQGTRDFTRVIANDDTFNRMLAAVDLDQARTSYWLSRGPVLAAIRDAKEGGASAEVLSAARDVAKESSREFRRELSVLAGMTGELRRMAREEGQLTEAEVDATIDASGLAETYNLGPVAIDILRERGITDISEVTNLVLDQIILEEKSRLEDILTEMIGASEIVTPEVARQLQQQLAAAERDAIRMADALDNATEKQIPALEKKLAQARQKVKDVRAEWRQKLQEAREKTKEVRGEKNKRIAELRERHKDQMQRLREAQKMRAARNKAVKAIFAKPQKSMKAEYSVLLEAVQRLSRPTQRNAAARDSDLRVWQSRESLYETFPHLRQLEPEWIGDGGSWRNRDIFEIEGLLAYTLEMRKAGKAAKQEWSLQRQAETQVIGNIITTALLKGQPEIFAAEPVTEREPYYVKKAWGQLLGAQRNLDRLDGLKGFEGPIFKEIWNGFTENEARYLRQVRDLHDQMVAKQKELGIKVDDFAKMHKHEATTSISDFYTEKDAEMMAAEDSLGMTRLESWAELNNVKDTAQNVTYELQTQQVMALYLGMRDINTAETIIFGNKIPPKVINHFVAQLTDAERAYADWMAEEYQKILPRLQAFSIDTFDVPLAGVQNYFPMVLMGQKYESFQEELLTQSRQRAPLYAGTDKTYLKSRTNIRPEHRKAMDLQAQSLFITHMDKVYRTLEMEQYAQRTNFALKSDAVRRAARQANKEAALNAVIDWFDKAVNPAEIYKRERTVWDGMREKSTVAALAFRGGIMMRQVPSLVYFFPAAGVDFFTSVGQTAAHPKADIDFVQQHDPSALGTMDRDLRNVQRQAKIHKNIGDILRSVGEKGMQGIVAFDRGVKISGWMSVYRHVYRKTGSHEAAVNAARNITRRTQPVGGIPDVPAILRSGGPLSLFTQFSSQLTQIFGMLWHDAPSYFKAGDYGTAGATIGALALGSTMIWIMRNGFQVDPDDDEQFGRLLVDSLIGPIPVFGQQFVSAQRGFDGSVPAMGWIRSMARLSGSVSRVMQGEQKDGDLERGAKEIVRMLGPLTGLPSAQMATMIDAAKSEDPWILMMFQFEREE